MKLKLFILFLSMPVLAAAQDFAVDLSVPVDVSQPSVVVTPSTTPEVESVFIDPVNEKIVVRLKGVDRAFVIEGDGYAALKASEVRTQFLAQISAAISAQLAAD